MEIVKMESLPTTKTPRGAQARFLVDRKDVHVVNIVMKAGEDVASHVTPVDVLFYVIKGRGVVEIGDETAEVSETDIIVSPKDIPHALKASLGSEFSVLVIRTPNPKPTGK
jgi:quercetin dioxygenase-like cupin family protein